MILKQRHFIKKYIENGGNGTQAAMDVYSAKNYNYSNSYEKNISFCPKYFLEEFFQAVSEVYEYSMHYRLACKLIGFQCSLEIV